MRTLSIVTVLLVLTTGCASQNLEKLRRTEPKGTAFQQALAREYLAYAAQEERNYDWADSWHFADKGLTAAYGNDVGPEDPTQRDIKGETLAELEAARDTLLSALSPPVVEAMPLLAARAYIQFDCWVEMAEDGWETEKIAACREGFRDSLAELNQARAATVASPSGSDTSSYLVFFEWNRASLSKAGKAVVADVIATLAGTEAYEIVLNGHTDTTGLERFNLKLSQKRAETVAAALVAGGIDRQHITVFAFGESDPAIPTPDNTNEPRNRRVEIFIQ